MIERHHADPVERAELTEQDLVIATPIGRYVERREAGQPPRAHDLLAAAAEFGDTAVDVLRTVLACYEACAPATTSPPDRRPNRTRRSPMPRPIPSTPVRSEQLQ